jgi:hypothetical protein
VPDRTAPQPDAKHCDPRRPLADDDGVVPIFSLSADRAKSVKKLASPRGTNDVPLHEINMPAPIKTMPVVANNILYIATENELFAIQAGGNGGKIRNESN